MDNHPIPQDVTGFQFKLIGNMTVKQFAYLASGVVLGWIFYQLPINFLIKFPFSAFSVIFGLGLAFFPVSGRPMDMMIGNYIKALIRPTQFLYEKTGGQIYYPHKAAMISKRDVKQYKNDASIFPKDKLKAYLESLDAKPKSKVDEKENNFLMSVASLATNNSSYQTAPIVQPQPTPMTNPTPLVNPAPIQITPPVPNPQPPVSVPPAKEDTRILQTPRTYNKSMGVPNVPEFPNLITGITKDPRGNALSNILVEVKDKDGNPVRAFKTNELGRFASATPLINGTYAIEFEDPKAQNKFEKMTINVAGQIIMPIEASKTTLSTISKISMNFCVVAFVFWADFFILICLCVC